MKKIWLSIILLLAFLPNPSFSQSTIFDGHEFTKFVGKNYRLSDSLKSNCEWMYAVVRVKTNSANKIIGYDFINNPPGAMQKAFGFLIGYKFPSKAKINKRPVIFYLGIDNLSSCTEKPGDLVYYAPNRVVGIMATHMFKVWKESPNAIMLSNTIIIGGGESYN